MKATISYYKYSLSLILSQGQKSLEIMGDDRSHLVLEQRELSHQQKRTIPYDGEGALMDTLLKGFPGPKKRLKSMKKPEKY